MATLARMHVELVAKGDKFEREMKKAKSVTGRLREELTKTRSLMGLLAGATGAGLATKAMFDLGSAVEETGSKFRTVFGESTKEVQQFIDQFGTLAGLSNEQAQGVLATTGSIVQGMGFAEEASARFSTEVVKLAGDLSSFNNIPIEETSLAIQAALTGEREQLKRLGIVLREADVQQRALAISGGDAAKAAQDQVRATASLQLITERAGVAVGDLERTQDSAANRARAFRAEIRNLAESLSVALLPTMAGVLEKLVAFVGGMKIWVAEIKLGIATLKFWKEEWFGTEESILAAEVAMERALLNLVHLKDEIASGLGGSGEGGLPNLSEGADDVGNSLSIANAKFREMSVMLPGLNEEFGLLAPRVVGLTGPVGEATEQMTTMEHTIMRLENAGVRMASVFSQSIVNSVTDGAKAFQRFGVVVLQTLADIAARMVVLQVLSALLPGSGFVGSLASSFGFGDDFDGFFAKGGHIDAGKWGIVGDEGPEAVRGPADVKPMEQMGGTTLNINMPSPSSKFEQMAQQWLEEGLRQAEHNGFRVNLGTT